MKIKPFLRWAGGKQNLADSLLSCSPNDELINKYYEPFLGAGSLFFSNGFNNAEISDINLQLVNSYKQIKQNHEKVYHLLSKYTKKFLADKQYYYTIRSSFNKNFKKCDYIQACRFIFLIHTNYNGIYRVNNNGQYNVPMGRLKPYIPTLEHLKEISNKLERITINCQDYTKILGRVQENDFIYLDPPYPPADWSKPTNQYTIKTFTKEDHENLYLFANELRKKGCFVLISYPENGFIKELYSDWFVENSHIYRSISCKKQRKKVPELFIKNY